MWNTDMQFYASLTFCFFLVHPLFTVMILCDHLQMGRIGPVASSMHRFNLYFCFIDFMIRFTDSMLFLSLCIGYSHDTLQTYMWAESFQ